MLREYYYIVIFFFLKIENIYNVQSGGSILDMKNEDHSHGACMVDEYFARSRSSKFSIHAAGFAVKTIFG